MSEWRERLSTAWKGVPGRALRVALVVCSCVLVARRLDGRAILASLERFGWRAMLASFLFQVMAIGLASLRWRVVLAASGADRASMPSMGYLTRANFVAAYMSLLPVPMAPEIVRAERTRGCFPAVASSYGVVVVERTSGLVALVALAVLGAIASPKLDHPGIDLALRAGVAFALAAMVAVLVASRFDSPAVRQRLDRVPVVGKHLSSIRLPRGVGATLATLALALAIQALVVGAAWVLFVPVEPRATLAVCMLLIPAVLISLVIPLTPAGFGQREAAFAALFHVVGVAPETSLAVSLGWAMTGIATCGIGFLVSLIEPALAWPVRVEPSRAEP